MRKKIIDNITNIRIGKMTEDKPWVIDDAFSESKTIEPQCMTCKNERSEGTCTAYLDGILNDILTAKWKDCKFYITLI